MKDSKNKNYVDHAIDASGKMVMVAVNKETKESGDELVPFYHNYSIDFSDTKTRSVSLKEKLINWLILKLGGEIKECYTRKWESVDNIFFKVKKNFDLYCLPESSLENNNDIEFDGHNTTINE